MNTPMETAEKIKTHLEFLGYEPTIQDKRSEGGLLVVQASSKQKPNLILWFNDNGTVGVKSGWNGMKKMETTEQWDFVNKCNSEVMFMARMYIDNDGDLQFQTVYMGDYDKTVFGNFIDIMNADISRVLSNPDFKRLLVK